MRIEDIYAMMKNLRDQMYKDDETAVVINQREFFAIYQMVCYMMQIRRIVEDDA